MSGTGLVGASNTIESVRHWKCNLGRDGAVVSRQKESTGTLALCSWEMLNKKRVRDVIEEEGDMIFRTSAEVPGGFEQFSASDMFPKVNHRRR